nr:10924_t:CDS:2 [Entrophospora candida]
MKEKGGQTCQSKKIELLFKDKLDPGDDDIGIIKKNAIGIALVQNLPIAIIFLPATDIAKFVEGNADLGITGQDMVAESLMSEKVEEIIELEFGKCKLQTQAPVRNQIKDFKELRKELLEKKLKLSTLVASCVLGLAGVIEQILTILTSQAILIKNKRPKNPSLITSCVKGVVAAKKYVLVDYNIERINLKQAAKITPGRQALMISLLEDVNWIEVQSMVCREEVANVMDKLEEIGATDILNTNYSVFFDMTNECVKRWLNKGCKGNNSITMAPWHNDIMM